jgi:hypothetical protein
MHFNMIAGGTRITPVMQISAEILRNVDDNTRAMRVTCSAAPRICSGCTTSFRMRHRRAGRSRNTRRDSWVGNYSARSCTHAVTIAIT